MACQRHMPGVEAHASHRAVIFIPAEAEVTWPCVHAGLLRASCRRGPWTPARMASGCCGLSRQLCGATGLTWTGLCQVGVDVWAPVGILRLRPRPCWHLHFTVRHRGMLFDWVLLQALTCLRFGRGPDPPPTALAAAVYDLTLRNLACVCLAGFKYCCVLVPRKLTLSVGVSSLGFDCI
jgi:hypothetical protein